MPVETRNIQETLQLPYDRSTWAVLLSEVFPNVAIFQAPQRTDRIKPDFVKELLQIGNVRLEDGKNLAVFEASVSDKINLARNRVALRELITGFIDQGTTHGVLCIFNSADPEYRFTFVSKETVVDEAGQIVTSETNPRRFTYILGPGESRRTAAQRFQELAAKRNHASMADLVDAFSVERLNKEFFDHYKGHYQAFVDHLLGHTELIKRVFGVTSRVGSDAYEKECKAVRDWVKKLLGRIVFIYFLQKKGWMGCKALSKSWQGGDPQFLKTLFNQTQAKDLFYSQSLVPLFFDALNTPDRQGDIFQITGTKVPYLNGGLFENSEDQTRDINFPAAMFSDLLDFFSSYNFTIDENDPEDHEVGIDPEMLGHIFENLLEENKDKGAYYTPKPIVQFMCQQSLLAYLKEHLGDQPGLEELVRNKNPGDSGKTNWIRKNAPLIEKLLDEVKICDPAIGSGAFPMGVLHEIFWIKLALDWTLNDPTQFAEIKRRIIENTIYGVDIDPGAIEIARLRCWLALVTDDGQPRPLPNLDFKIHCADSLLESLRGETVNLSSAILKEGRGQKLVESLVAAKRALFEATRVPEKRTARVRLYKALVELGMFEYTWLRNQADQFESRAASLSAHLKEFARVDALLDATKGAHAKATDETLESVERWLDDKQYPTFAWAIHFGEVLAEGGFDIVIGNPPYVRNELIPEETKNLLGEKFPSISRRSDLYCYFYLQTFNIVRPSGVAVFLCSNSWLDVGYGAALQSYLLNHGRVCSVVDSSSERVFESASINPVISIHQVRKMETDDATEFVSLRGPFAACIASKDQQRIVSKKRSELLADGTDVTGKYTLAKWGGRYLKAPDVFFEVEEMLRKSHGRISDLARVEFGLKTGANPFFHVELIEQSSKGSVVLTTHEKVAETHKLGPEVCLTPCLISSKEIKTPLITRSVCSKYLVEIPASTALSPATRAYISWGESKGFANRPSTRRGGQWYAIERPAKPSIAFASAYDRRLLLGLLDPDEDIVVDKRFYAVYPHRQDDSHFIGALLYSTFGMMSREVLGRANFGDGMLEVVVGEALQLPVPTNVPNSLRRELADEFRRLCSTEIGPFYEEANAGKRDRLDDLFLVACGFDSGSRRNVVRNELKRETCRLMYMRNARSGKGQEATRPLESFFAC